MLDSYRHVLRRPGTVSFSTAAVLARLPSSMVTLGIVLLVAAASGSYGLAGTVSAVYVLAQAAVAVLHGRWLDQYGQGRVLPLTVLVYSASLSVMVLSVQEEWSLVTTYVSAAVAGASLPHVGASVRARWSYVLDDPREVQTAYALESVLDEVVFMVGPVLATVLATAWHPVAGLAVAISACLAGTLGYAAQRRTEPPRRQPGRRAGEDPMPWPVVLLLAVVSLAQGTIFGVAEVATVAFAEEQGRPGLSGALLACWAVGSLVAGIATGVVVWRSHPVVRVQVGMVALTLALVPPVLVDSVPALAGVMLLGGTAIAPTLIAVFTLVEQTVPASRLTEGMTVLHTGMIAGIAPGATLAGLVVDRHGGSPGFLVAVAAGVVGILAALATGAWTRARPARDAPVGPSAH